MRQVITVQSIDKSWACIDQPFVARRMNTKSTNSVGMKALGQLSDASGEDHQKTGRIRQN